MSLNIGEKRVIKQSFDLLASLPRLAKPQNMGNACSIETDNPQREVASASFSKRTPLESTLQSAPSLVSEQHTATQNSFSITTPSAAASRETIFQHQRAGMQPDSSYFSLEPVATSSRGVSLHRTSVVEMQDQRESLRELSNAHTAPSMHAGSNFCTPRHLNSLETGAEGADKPDGDNSNVSSPVNRRIRQPAPLRGPLFTSVNGIPLVLLPGGQAKQQQPAAAAPPLLSFSDGFDFLDDAESTDMGCVVALSRQPGAAALQSSIHSCNNSTSDAAGSSTRRRSRETMVSWSESAVFAEAADTALLSPPPSETVALPQGGGGTSPSKFVAQGIAVSDDDVVFPPHNIIIAPGAARGVGPLSSSLQDVDISVQTCSLLEPPSASRWSEAEVRPIMCVSPRSGATNSNVACANLSSPTGSRASGGGNILPVLAVHQAVFTYTAPQTQLNGEESMSLQLTSSLESPRRGDESPRAETVRSLSQEDTVLLRAPKVVALKTVPLVDTSPTKAPKRKAHSVLPEAVSGNPLSRPL